ncbi:MAG: hypothetical protein CM15mP45_23000 [Deltaproteobacteria bacterium]|nr:MAG: hypothetical protein CM15mP45_23000 [Deltaproteobacteria bacterium]
MMEGPEEGSKGASLGLVEMARRSGYPIEFAFEEINQEHTFLYQSNCIDEALWKH